VRDALDGHGRLTASPPACTSTRLFGRGGLVSPDAKGREGAVQRTVAAADSLPTGLAPTSSSGQGSRGHDYPFQTPLQGELGLADRGDRLGVGPKQLVTVVRICSTVMPRRWYEGPWKSWRL